jgi:hypothetical protein
MKKTILMTFIVCIAFAINGNAQTKASSPKDAASVEHPVKGGEYFAPAGTVVQPAPLVCQPLPITGTSSFNEIQSLNSKDSNDFPVYINTGNSEQDMENYRIAKDAWIEQNPEKYKAMQQPGQSINK